MSDHVKGKAELLKEITELRRRVEELEKVDAARRQVQEDLRRERDRAHGYLDIAGVILLALDDHARITLINRKGCEILGYEEEELIGKSWIDNFVPERLREEVRQIFDKNMAGEVEVADYFENPVSCRDGEERVISWHNTVLKGAAGKAIGTLSSGEDITDRLLVETALRESEARLRSIFQVAPTGIGLVSSQRVILQVNDRICNMLGYAREELVGKGASMVYASDEDFEYVGREKYRQIDELGMGSVETRWRRKDGKIIDIILSSAPVDPSDRSVGVIFTALDITERKRTRERMDRLNFLFLSLGADLIENIEKITKAAQDILQCPYAAFCLISRDKLSALSAAPGEEGFTVTARPAGHICYDFISMDSKEPMAVTDLGETEYPATDPLVARNGYRSYLGYPVVVEGKTVGCLSIFDVEVRDFSPEDIEIAGILAQALSVEQERLHREEDLKDFIDIASHEIRHPITIIKGYALTLREFWRDMDHDRMEELLGAIDHGAERLNRLALELLDVSRIERGHFPMNKREIALRPLLEKAISEVREAGYEHQFNLSFTATVSTVKFDPDRMAALLYALLENSAGYSPPDSEVDVEVKEGEAGVVISILDRGIGVPESEREKIFERFYQVEDALHHSLPGMGIGLYFAREIAEAHGGEIWHEPREGGGSVFRFTIPLD